MSTVPKPIADMIEQALVEVRAIADLPPGFTLEYDTTSLLDRKSDRVRDMLAETQRQAATSRDQPSNGT